MKCIEACVSHDCENFCNEEADLENTELDEDDFDLEIAFVLLLFSTLCFDNNHLIVSANLIIKLY